jgi:uncharacterized protein (DUF433 family)
MNIASGYRYIASTPGIRGGNPYLEGTRIAVHDVVAYHLLGCSVDEIHSRFEDLTRSQIYESLAFYEDHRAAIEALALSQTTSLME